MYLTVNDMMSIYGISRSTAYKLVNTDGFPAIRIGKSIRIDQDSLKHYLNEMCPRMCP